MDVIKSLQISSRLIEKVVVHPLVLLSVVDHYNREATDTKKRVLGVQLGTSFKGSVDVTNSYAVPFEEDGRDPSIWFLDHNYHESIFSRFRRINAKEHVVGWYSIGPKLKENDLSIHGLFHDYIPTPVLVIIDVRPKEHGMPTKAYYTVEEVKENDTPKNQKVFVHAPSEIAADEVGTNWSGTLVKRCERHNYQHPCCRGDWKTCRFEGFGCTTDRDPQLS